MGFWVLLSAHFLLRCWFHRCFCIPNHKESEKQPKEKHCLPELFLQGLHLGAGGSLFIVWNNWSCTWWIMVVPEELSHHKWSHTYLSINSTYWDSSYYCGSLMVGWPSILQSFPLWRNFSSSYTELPWLPPWHSW